jgi:LemA protein
MPQFHDLTVELEGTENRIARARQEYNNAVKNYNAELAKVGGSVVNKVTGHPFKPRIYWSASAEAHEAPKVQF